MIQEDSGIPARYLGTKKGHEIMLGLELGGGGEGKGVGPSWQVEKVAGEAPNTLCRGY